MNDTIITRRLQMKLLLTLLLTFNIFAGDQSRIATSVLNELKTVSSSHCVMFPLLEEGCTEDFKLKLDKKIKSFNSLLINEKFSQARREIKGKIKYEKLLDKESITYEAGLSFKQMSNLYTSTMKERNCVAGSKSYLDSVNITYQANDTCAILRPIVQEKQCVDNSRLALDELTIAYTQENTCEELQALIPVI